MAGFKSVGLKAIVKLGRQREVSAPAGRDSDGSQPEQQERERSGFWEGSGIERLGSPLGSNSDRVVDVVVLVFFSISLFTPYVSGRRKGGSVLEGVKVFQTGRMHRQLS